MSSILNTVYLPATRPVKRLLAAILVLISFIILSALLEPRHTSLSCRSFRTCLVPHLHPDYEITTVPEEQQVAVTESNLADGTMKFSRKLKTQTPSVLFLVLTRDGHSWSRDFQSTRRSIYDFLDLLANTKLEPTTISLGLMTGSKSEYDMLKKATDEIPLGRVTILWRNETEVDLASAKGEADPQMRDQWSAAMAKQRNYLMSRALLDETHIVWVDAGVVEFSDGLVQRMMSHASARKDISIITAQCEWSQAESYDTSTWALAEDSKLFHLGSELDAAGGAQELSRSRRMLPQLIAGTADDDLLHVHSVGGTVLYMKAELVRQGLTFPWWKVVGTTWNEEGWTGLDTEGLCYLSGRMGGGGCYVLGGTHRVRHTDVL